MTARTILFSERCILGGGHEPLRVEPAHLEITGPWITGITVAAREEGPRPDGSSVELSSRIDLGDRLLSPAFINGHTHLSMASFRGIGGVNALAGNVVEDLYYRLESQLEPEAIRAFSRVGAYENLLQGVGLVWDHYYGGLAVAEALRDVGLGGVVAPTLQDVAGPGCPKLEQQLIATEDIDSDPTLHEVGIAAALGPHATDTVSAELWGRIHDLSARRDLPVHFHCAQSFREYRRSFERHGCSPLQWLHRENMLDSPLRLLLVHGIYLDAEDLGLLDPQRHVLGFCPFSQVQFCFPADAPGWTEAGLPWLLATDCVPSNDSMNVQKEMRLVGGMRGFMATNSTAYRDFRAAGGLAAAEAAESSRQEGFERWKGLADPQFLLSRVWSVPGGMHPRLRAGALELGRLANLVVWDPRHPSFWPSEDPLRALAMSDTTQAIDAMMVAGRWIGERGNFHRSLIDDAAYRDAHDEAQRRLTEHLERLGLDPS